MFALLTGVSGAWATGEVTLGSQVTDLSTLSPSKYYVLKNVGSQKYNYYDVENSQMDAKTDLDYSCIVKLGYDNTNVTIQQLITGTYYQQLGNTRISLGTTAVNYTFNTDGVDSGQFRFANNNLYMNRYGGGTEYPTGAATSFTGNYSRWNIYEVTNNIVLYSKDTGTYTAANQAGTWASAWCANGSIALTLSTGANNIDVSTGYIYSGSNGCKYTLTAPKGYLITGYTISGTAQTNAQTLTPAAGGSAQVFATSGTTTLSVSGIATMETSFTHSTPNKGIAISSFAVFLTPINNITSLPTANNKAYFVVAKRGTWNFADNATSMSVSSVAHLNNTNEHIALIYKDQNYYLYSVHAGKYLTADNTLTSLPSNDEQVDIIATGDATYPWFFRFKNLKDGNDKYTKNINISNGTIKIDGWGPDGSNTSGSLDEGNRVAILEADDFDATAALAMFDQRNITYNLSYGGNTLRTESGVTTFIGGYAEEFIPSSFVVPGVTYSYEPETIGASTMEVTVTASWTNDIFHISTAGNELWYAVDMHSSHNNYTWKYDAETGEVQTPVIAKDAYYNITDNNLFCFMGNPWDGFKIYNKAAGSSKTLRKATTGNTVSYMSDTDDHNLFKLYASASGYISNAYCFKLDGDDYYLNKQNSRLQGWTARDEGSSCRFFTPGSFYVNFINTLNLDAPLGSVGTKAYITDQAQIDNLEELKELCVGNPFVVVGEENNLANILDPIRNSETIALGTGYWRLVSAYPGYVEKQGKRPAIYYNSDNDQLRWSIDGLTTDYQVNSVIQLGAGSADGKYTIYSPNAQKFLNTTETGQSQNLGTLGATGSDITFTSLGSAQHQIFVSGNENGFHTNVHSNGAGTGNTIVSWNGGANTASAWYIVKANELDITLNDGGDGYYYATMCLPFDVTLSAACAYTLTLNGEYLTLAEAISAVPAGTPVLLRHTANSVKATIANDASTAAPLTTTALTGSYVPTAVDGDGLVNSQKVYTLGRLNGQIGFYWYNGTSIGANKAYLLGDSSSQVRGFTFNFTDGISSIASQTGDNTAIYDMQGRRVNNATRGLYIQNGKKILK